MTDAHPTDRNLTQLSALLFRIGRSENAALQSLYLLTAAKLFGVCLRICGERQAAEDVLQEVYLTIWKRAAGYDPARGTPLAWMATIARNRAIDWVRAQGGRASIPIDQVLNIADSAPLASASLIDNEETSRLHLCLERLEERQRIAIRTAFFDGLTYAELAQRQSVPLGTMKSWVRRGLRQLKICVDYDN